MSAQLAAQRRGGYRRQFHPEVRFAESAQRNAGGFKGLARAMKRGFIGYFANDKIWMWIKLTRKSRGGFNCSMEGLNGALGDREVAAGDDVQARRAAIVLNLRKGLHANTHPILLRTIMAGAS